MYFEGRSLKSITHLVTSNTTFTRSLMASNLGFSPWECSTKSGICFKTAKDFAMGFDTTRLAVSQNSPKLTANAPSVSTNLASHWIPSYATIATFSSSESTDPCAPCTLLSDRANNLSYERHRRVPKD
ncbi:hypothetical protein Leryth_006535 [Lithospermum erythrorhizon]|nr:hypothetical protein Leryth_006535 [Lithospermum erythrorhizon]